MGFASTEIASFTIAATASTVMSAKRLSPDCSR